MLEDRGRAWAQILRACYFCLGRVRASPGSICGAAKMVDLFPIGKFTGIVCTVDMS